MILDFIKRTTFIDDDIRQYLIFYKHYKYFKVFGYHVNGESYLVKYYKFNKLHKVGVALIKRWTNGNLQEVVYYKYNIIHRVHGVSKIIWFSSVEVVQDKYYYKKNILHRYGGVALTIYNETQSSIENYFINGFFYKQRIV